MTAVYLTDPPPLVADWLAERTRLGQDRRDEMWEGVLHVAPYASTEHAYLESEVGAILRRLARAAGLFATGSVNLGEPGDYRVPDHAVHREKPRGVYRSTAAAVVEILSPGDETFQKFPFYARRGVEEIVAVDGATQAVRVWQLGTDGYVETGVSALLGVTAAEFAADIDWP